MAIEKNQPNLLWNSDLAPVSSNKKDWKLYNMAALWICMTITIPTYMIGSSTISSGMNWWQSMIIVLVANFILWVLLLFIGYMGVKHSVPFPVLARLSFGVKGARIAALIRASVACGWFGVCTWIQGNAFYILLKHLFPYLQDSFYLGNAIGLNLAQFSCFLLFFGIQIFIIKRGIKIIKWIETIAAPLLLIVGFLLLFWVLLQVGSFKTILNTSYQLKSRIHAHFWPVFLTDIGAVLASWLAIVVNIPDFTRYVKKQRDQVIGQFIGLIPSAVLFTFIGIVVTSATIVMFSAPVWDPVMLLDKLHNNILIFFASILIIIATLTTNIGANVVAAANDFSSLYPKKISFKKGGYIAATIGMMLFPWKLTASHQNFILYWLFAYSGIIVALLGIIICDYYIIREKEINVSDLYSITGQYCYYKGWNLVGFAALFIAIVPILPGFLSTMGWISQTMFPAWMLGLYKYDWIISFFIAFFTYWILMRGFYKTILSNNEQTREVIQNEA